MHLVVDFETGELFEDLTGRELFLRGTGQEVIEVIGEVVETERGELRRKLSRLRFRRSGRAHRRPPGLEVGSQCLLAVPRGSFAGSLTDRESWRSWRGGRSADGGFQEVVGHGDGPRLADLGLGRGDEINARVNVLELRGFAEAIEDLGNMNAPLGAGTVVIFPSENNTAKRSFRRVVVERHERTKGAKTLLYESKGAQDEPWLSHPKGESLDVFPFIPRVLSQIPEPRKQGVHYFGAYASRSRVIRKKRGLTLHPLGDNDNSKSKTEAELSTKKRAAL